MKKVFADTGFWIALFYRDDQYHQNAIKLSRQVTLEKISIFTSEMVLVEFLNFFTRFNPQIRYDMAVWVTQVREDPAITVIPQSSIQSERAVAFYLDRVDQQWSLTDCSSFLLMTELRITDALAHDKHFQQAGFRALLRAG
jgi:uncharacterized protein